MEIKKTIIAKAELTDKIIQSFLVIIIILVLLPVLVTGSADAGWGPAGWALLKAGIFVASMLLLGNRLVPMILNRVAHTRSRELFVLAAITIALGTALASAERYDRRAALTTWYPRAVPADVAMKSMVDAPSIP